MFCSDFLAMFTSCYTLGMMTDDKYTLVFIFKFHHNKIFLVFFKYIFFVHITLKLKNFLLKLETDFFCDFNQYQ